ncbi:MAG: SxtJ family membrane protein [Holophagales bacterium]|nr:SxtJ family membrane protein [Holophagales bacterium]
MSIRRELSHLDTTIPTLRRFGLVVGGIFVAIGAFLMWRQVGWAPILFWIGGPLVLLGALVPRVLRLVYLGWMGIALVFGSIVTPILLTIFFFLVVTPLALFFRLIGRDALHRRLDRDAPSYWIDKEVLIADRSRYEKFF